MSFSNKFFAITTTVTVGTIIWVHFQQKSERERMSSGVKRDEERMKVRAKALGLPPPSFDEKGNAYIPKE